MGKMITRASSINRALDQIGDKWCVLIIQEVFWGINSFTEMMSAMGVSRGVLSDRLKWLQSVDCLRQSPERIGGKRMKYHLTRKSIDLYDNALMALSWERQFFRTPELDDIALVHTSCGHAFAPELRCRHCNKLVEVWDVSYKPGPGATRDERDKKVRRRSSIPVANVPSKRSIYKNLINIVGDRWTANIIALSFHGLTRFDQFHQELPVATNILADRLKFLVEQGVFEQSIYLQRPLRYEYKLTSKGEATYPYFLTLLQWGDKWCNPTGKGKPMRLTHTSCGRALHGQVKCSECGGKLKAREVEFSPGEQGLT
jgi:DNA-binding HxlR family transcriptional regulator